MLTEKNKQVRTALPPDRRKKGLSFARAAGSYVPQLTNKAFEKFGFHTAEIMLDWPRIAGTDIASWTAPERIRWPRLPNGDTVTDGGPRRGSTLTLRVEPARALDVEYRAAEIIDRINRYFGYRAVETLKLVQAPLERGPEAFSDNAQAPKPAAPATHDEATAITADLEPALGEALGALWRSVRTAGRR